MTADMTAELLACRLTPRGRGAVATIGVQGRLERLDPFFRAANGRSLGEQPLQRICFGHWGTGTGEEVVGVRTDETKWELHCHGGPAAVERILRDVESIGGRIVDQQAWDGRSFAPIDAECRNVLTRTTTRDAAHHALRQTNLFPQAVRQFLTLSPADCLTSIENMLAWGTVATHLLIPWQVVLCGRPNVGKSSLINALIGFERTVVFDQPGTTRDVVTAETAFHGWPVTLSDTAGLRETDSELEAAGIARARLSQQKADLVVIVLDATSGITPEDQELIKAHPNAVIVWNKCDLVPQSTVPEHALPVSALTQAGLPELIERLSTTLVPAGLPVDQPFPISLKQNEELQQWRDLLRCDDIDAFRQSVMQSCS